MNYLYEPRYCEAEPYRYVNEAGSVIARGWTVAEALQRLPYTIDSGQGIAPAVTAGPPGLDWDDKPTDAPGGDDPDTGPHERTPILADYAIELLKAAAIVAAHPLCSGPALWWEAQS